MSDDLPLAQPPGRMTAPGVPPQRHAWERHRWLLDAFQAVIAGLTLVEIARADEPAGHRVTAAAAVVTLAVWYGVLARPLVPTGFVERSQRHRRILYQAGVFACVVPATVLVGSTGLLTVALILQTFLLWPTWWAISVSALLIAATSVPALLRAGGQILQALPSAAVPFLFVVVLGLFVNRVIAQSAERAELINELVAARSEVARLSHEAGVAVERQRLAGDIHDTVAQGLSSVVMLIQAADAELGRDPDRLRQHLVLATRTARESLAEVRALVAALTPAALANGSLPEALRRLLDRFEPAATEPAEPGTPGRATTMSIAGEPRPLPTAVEVVLLRAAQESLANAGKHAAADRVTLELRYGSGEVSLTVTDDGCGFVPERPTDGYGLAAMRARVEQVGGAITVRSAPDAGTEVRVEVPA